MLQKHNSCILVNLKKDIGQDIVTHNKQATALKGWRMWILALQKQVLPGKVGVNMKKTESAAQANVSIHNKH